MLAQARPPGPARRRRRGARGRAARGGRAPARHPGAGEHRRSRGRCVGRGQVLPRGRCCRGPRQRRTCPGPVVLVGCSRRRGHRGGAVDVRGAGGGAGRRRRAPDRDGGPGPAPAGEGQQRGAARAGGLPLGRDDRAGAGNAVGRSPRRGPGPAGEGGLGTGCPGRPDAGAVGSRAREPGAAQGSSRSPAWRGAGGGPRDGRGRAVGVAVPAAVGHGVPGPCGRAPGARRTRPVLGGGRARTLLRGRPAGPLHRDGPGAGAGPAGPGDRQGHGGTRGAGRAAPAGDGLDHAPVPRHLVLRGGGGGPSGRGRHRHGAPGDAADPPGATEPPAA